MPEEKLVEELSRRILHGIASGALTSRRMVEEQKRRLSKQLGLGSVPPSTAILSYATGAERQRALALLLKKPTRTLSGVAVVTVQTSPLQTCPGRCIYCPTYADAPKSYTGEEPASLRARQCGFDPYLQVSVRLRQLKAMGHPTSKVELVVQGATFPAMDLQYRRWFVARCLQAMVEFDGPSRGHMTPMGLEEAIREAAEAETRPVGITFETRPDWCSAGQVAEMLQLGATRVEIGVQTLSNRVYRLTNRGHTVADVERAFKAARGGGLKICAHMMLGLPGTTARRDLESFRALFGDPAFRPDELKIYPTLVIRGTGLYQMWKRGEYQPLDDEELVERLVEIKSIVPPWVRIKRVMRDIPSKMIAAGPRRSDMRNLARLEMEKRGKRCMCIRCREVSRMNPHHFSPSLMERRYTTSNGEEVFLSFEDPENGALAAFLRLSLQEGRCYVRELHTYGPAVKVGTRPAENQWQHRGLGTHLLERAEELARQEGYDTIQVTSGIGARQYYSRLGYTLLHPYMVKPLRRGEGSGRSAP